MADRQPLYGSDLIVDLLQQFGVEYLAINPGSSLRGLHESVVNYGQNHPRLIECTHEEIAVGIANGYAKASGKVMAAAVHDLVGLLHCCMNLFYAYLDREPVLLLGGTGPMDAARRRPTIDWIHTALINANAIRDYVKWDDQPFSIDAIPDSFARAYRVANTEPRGPVYLCYDNLLQEEALDHEVRLPERSKGILPSRFAADRAALAEAAELLASARRPVIVTEYLGRNPSTVAALVELAESIVAPVVDLGGRFNFPNRHPLSLDLPLASPRESSHAVASTGPIAEADVLLALDVRDLAKMVLRVDREHRRIEYLPAPDRKLIEIGFGDTAISSWSQEFQRFQQVDLSILGDTTLAVPELAELCRAALERHSDVDRRGRFEAIRRQHDEAFERSLAEAREQWNASPISTARLATELGEAIKQEDWVLTANTLQGWTRRLWDFDKPHRHLGGPLGTGTQLPISLGAALAHRGSGKLIVDIQPDGDLLFDVGALWTAVHDQIPLLVIMFNNRAYYQDYGHQILLSKVRGRPTETAYIGQELDNPAPDFATIARGFGWHAEGPILEPDRIRPAIDRAIRAVKEGQPALVDSVTQFR